MGGVWWWSGNNFCCFLAWSTFFYFDFLCSNKIQNQIKQRNQPKFCVGFVISWNLVVLLVTWKSERGSKSIFVDLRMLVVKNPSVTIIDVNGFSRISIIKDFEIYVCCYVYFGVYVCLVLWQQVAAVVNSIEFLL